MTCTIRHFTVIGFFIGAFIGHADLASKLLTIDFDWVEIYQSLLIPSFLFAALGCAAGISAAGIKLVRGDLNLMRLNRICTAAAFCCTGFLSLHFVLYIMFMPQSRIWMLGLDSANAVIWTFLLAALAVRLSSDFAALLQILEKRKIISIFQNYLFCLLFFMLGCLGFDLYNYFFSEIPRSMQKTHSAKPNIILITLDTVRADALSPYSSLPTSPALLELSRRSFVFENAVTPSPWTLPAHASIFTGMNPHRHNTVMTHQKLLPEYDTLAEILRGQGYTAAGFVGGPFCKGKFGLKQGFNYYRDRLGFFEYIDFWDASGARNTVYAIFGNLIGAPLARNQEKLSKDINRDVFAWLEQNGSQNFFLFINYFDAHFPYYLGSNYYSLFSDKSLKPQPVNSFAHWILPNPDKWYQKLSVSNDFKNEMKNLYYAEIRHQDDSFKNLLNRLETMDLMDNTIIIVTADHGEEFFEHGGIQHIITLYDEVLRVPLIIYLPKSPGHKRISQRVSITDIFPTILELTGQSPARDIDGTSLIPLMSGEGTYYRKYIISERYGRPNVEKIALRSIYKDDWKLIEPDFAIGRVFPALYNLRTDPKEQNNLYEQETAKREELLKILNSYSLVRK